MPTPDFIIPDNFLPLGGDTLEYWMYPDATWAYGPGDLPVNGVDSLDVGGAVGPNSPTNYAGDSGSVNLNTAPIPTVSDWGVVVMILLMLTAGTVVLARSQRSESRRGDVAAGRKALSGASCTWLASKSGLFVEQHYGGRLRPLAGLADGSGGTCLPSL